MLYLYSIATVRLTQEVQVFVNSCSIVHEMGLSDMINISALILSQEVLGCHHMHIGGGRLVKFGWLNFNNAKYWGTTHLRILTTNC